ncbi:hypothetical protein QR680_011860 [Steinernema hermaphroditum]|uniref:MSP domain-containing protein n=1 Tax=Steinernema hermaphroditum TaxID=289476 RepID=A0AA39I2H2_9BILA|nr:hypothetical protein QR680_011860 [Steinernema hermaphroditum]
MTDVSSSAAMKSLMGVDQRVPPTVKGEAVLIMHNAKEFDSLIKFRARDPEAVVVEPASETIRAGETRMVKVNFTLKKKPNIHTINVEERLILPIPKTPNGRRVNIDEVVTCFEIVAELQLVMFDAHMGIRMAQLTDSLDIVFVIRCMDEESDVKVIPECCCVASTNPVSDDDAEVEEVKKEKEMFAHERALEKLMIGELKAKVEKPSSEQSKTELEKSKTEVSKTKPEKPRKAKGFRRLIAFCR